MEEQLIQLAKRIENVKVVSHFTWFWFVQRAESQQHRQKVQTFCSRDCFRVEPEYRLYRQLAERLYEVPPKLE